MGLKSECLTRSAGCHCIHIIYENGRDFDSFYTIWMCDFIEMKYSSGTGRFWQVPFLYAQIDKKTGRDRFSVYREKQDEEGVKRREDFIK